MNSCWMDRSKKVFTVILVGSEWIVTIFLFVLFSFNVFFKLNELLMLSFSCLSLIFSSFYARVLQSNYSSVVVMPQAILPQRNGRCAYI